MRQSIFSIETNENIAKDVYRMTLSGDTSDITAPGQFVNIQLDGFYLRRPISVCDWGDGKLTLIYKILGRGTQAMSRYSAGAKLDILTGLGNGFDVEKAGNNPVLAGGGVGVPPMYGLAKRLRAMGKNVTVVMGFASKEDVFYEEELAALGCTVRVATVDGSYGTKGFVTDLMDSAYSYSYACGPIPMLKAVYDKLDCSGEYSFEERMGCGFGACMGCSCKTKYGSLRICKDGPVLEKEIIVW
ncbi:MAG: dihydroorotate dehydrogenase electron transfer subunit [Clostridia bacterium]|nr:dihydroorotate dehydrogenase electron transfer subunit [Clostridia bacterium]